MRVFVYEHLTACGLGRDPADPMHALFREGRAMRDAVASDFGQIHGVEVTTCRDAGAPVPREEVCAIAARCEWTLVIAPESDGVLTALTRDVVHSGGRLLGPGVEAVGLTSDKLALATHWREHGVPTPATTDRPPTACEAFPVVWKPRDGAGSTSTFLLNAPVDVARAKAVMAATPGGPMILQEFVPGTPASVAFLCGPAENVPLLPTFQHLTDDGRFLYRGGETPLPPGPAERAVRLGRAAIESVPGLRGFVGVDLVLGAAADGNRDYAIEINPRLTTSYVGLRALAGFNVAEAMLRAADGRPAPSVRWKPGRVRFAPDGDVAPAG